MRFGAIVSAWLCGYADPAPAKPAPQSVQFWSQWMKKPEHLCHHDGCINRAKWQCEMLLVGTPLKGATTLRVCSDHRKAAEMFVTNDDNRTRLANQLIREGLADPFTAYGLAKHNIAIQFDRLEQLLI